MIPNNKIKIKWISKTKSYYESKGYKFSKIGEDLFVFVNDLPERSRHVVDYICDYCLLTFKKSYGSLLINKKLTNRDCCESEECKKLKREDVYLLREFSKGKTLENSYPDLLLEWDYDKNINISPNRITSKSGRRVWWKCKKCEHEWESTVHNRAEGKGCPACAKRIPTINYNLGIIYPDLAKEFDLEENELTPFDYLPNAKKELYWKCSVCGHKWKAKINNRAKGNGCPKCGNRYRRTNDEFITEIYELTNGEYEVTGVFTGTHNKVEIKHLNCENIFETMPHSFLTGHRCPYCNESNGEKTIRKWLEKNNITFIQQYQFNDLLGINGGLLRFDFAILGGEHSITLIEYDGEFHFKKQYDNDGYESIQIHDQLKNEYCIKNNIKLVRIPYWDFNIIEEILYKELLKELF